MKLTKTHLMQLNIRYPNLHGPGCGNVWPPPDEVFQFFLHRPGRLWFAKLSGYDHKPVQTGSGGSLPVLITAFRQHRVWHIDGVVWFPSVHYSISQDLL